MGAFLRGQLLSAALATIIVGLGLFVIGVPYAMLLTVVVFIFEFVPQIGSYISGAIIIIFTFMTSGWQIGLIVALFSTFVQGVLQGQILQPRILGGAVGLHPIVSMFALLVGAALFGLPGAILAAPITGIVQVFVISAWHTWKQAHLEQFPEEAATN
jgi:predicted PurR-regulated permease PerM